MSKPSKGKKGKRSASERDTEVDPFFSEEEKAARLLRYENRELERHKVIDLHWFAAQGFDFPNLLLLQHLEKFCNLNGNIYPKLIREFYANLVNRQNDWITEVRGTRISVSLEALAQAAGFLNMGESAFDLADPDWVGANHSSTFLNCVRPGKRVDSKQMQVGLLNVNDRMLHYVIVYILVPRLFNKAQLKADDLKLIYALKNEVQVNWADVIRSHLIQRFKEPNAALPYPCLISKMITNAGVDVTNAAKLSLRERADKIDSRTLKKMKIGKKEGVWCWLEDNHPDLEEDESDDINVEETEKSFENPKSPHISYSQLEDLMDKFQGSLRDQLSQLRTEMAAQNQEIESLKEQVRSLYSLMETLIARKEKGSSSQPS